MSAGPDAAAASDLPALDRLLGDAAVAALIARHGRTPVVAALRTELERLRTRARAGTLRREEIAAAAIATALGQALDRAAAPRMRAVFNLTGTVLHTNLGRALLPAVAVEAAARAAAEPVDLEFDLASGRRGDRDAAVAALVCELTGAEAATIVNNNAAAVLLLLNTLAARREVIVSRGELVEIGGAFRIPDVMRSAGARLVEVGTTNRTHRHDYAAAIGPRSALLMKVHASNYAITGFTASVPETDLADLAHAHALPFAVDLGSGSLVDLSRWGLPKEPTVRETLAAGADLVAFSADKLLGGPQAGLVVGGRDLVRRLAKNHLKRALRLDKLRLAGLEATLRLYRDPDRLTERLPTLALLTRPAAALQTLAAKFRPRLADAIGPGFSVEAADLSSQIGSGALPLAAIPSAGLAVAAASGGGGALTRLAAAMRALTIPILGRIAEDRLLLDLRGLDDERALVDSLFELGLATAAGARA